MKNIRKEPIKDGKIIPLKFDYVFVSIFNNPKNIEILENFLSCYLAIPLNDIKGNLRLIPRDLELEGKRNKNKQVDLILDLNEDKINIELNNSFTDGIVERNIVYACNIHGRQLKYGDNTYSNISRLIQINFNVSKRCKTDNLVEEYKIMSRDGIILSDKIRVDIINVHKSKKKCYTLREEKLARWCKLLLAETKIDFEKTLGDDLMEEKARDTLVSEVDKYSKDEDVAALYSAYTKEELERNTVLEDEKKEARKLGREIGLKEGIKEGRKEGIKEGRKEGIKEGRIEGIKEGRIEGIKEGRIEEKRNIANSMLKNGLDISLISKLTGLTEEEISQI